MAELQVTIPETPTTEKPSSLGVPPDNPVEKTSQYLPLALKAIEERFSVSFSLIASVGYIVIAAFGKMDTLAQYLGYLIFLAICLCVYKLATVKISKLVLVLMTVCGLLLIYILSEVGFINWIGNRL